MTEPDWGSLRNHLESRRVLDIDARTIPRVPGIYIWFREGEPIYLGKATELRDRLGRHLKTDLDLSRSAFRRNVAEHIGVATVTECRIRPSILTTETVAKVTEWIGNCELGWVECASPDEAHTLEKRLLAEYKPPLNRASS